MYYVMTWDGIFNIHAKIGGVGSPKKTNKNDLDPFVKRIRVLSPAQDLMGIAIRERTPSRGIHIYLERDIHSELCGVGSGKKMIQIL